jgi:hypothetical protein
MSIIPRFSKLFLKVPFECSCNILTYRTRGRGSFKFVICISVL